MSTSHHSNGTITLNSFAELGQVLASGTFRDDSSVAQEETGMEQHDAPASPTNELAELVTQLAAVSGGLESMAREDARAREQATIDLARYEALMAEQHAAEQALAEAQRVRAAAEAFSGRAFSEQARTDAARRAATARAVELRCTELLAQCTRSIDELASAPHVARALDERTRLAEQQQEAAQRAEAAPPSGSPAAWTPFGTPSTRTISRERAGSSSLSRASSRRRTGEALARHPALAGASGRRRTRRGGPARHPQKTVSRRSRGGAAAPGTGTDQESARGAGAARLRPLVERVLPRHRAARLA